ncbi:MAG: YidC/Oxa1 family membrane protein insertase [Candidatus Moraniibacteriota bacterium]
MGALFHTLVSQPIYNSLIFFYNTIPGSDFGLAVIATTLLLRFLFIPLYKKQLESQKELQILQPKIKELQKQHKDDKKKQQEMIMKLYQEHKVNPFGGCLPIIIQVIFLIAIYQVIISISQGGFIANSTDLYSWVANPGEISHHFFGIADLAKPSYIFAVLAAIAQFYQVKMMLDVQKAAVAETVKESAPAEPDFAAIMNKQMLFIGPGMTLFIGITFPAALSLYWLVSTVFTIVQQVFIFKKK